MLVELVKSSDSDASAAETERDRLHVSTATDSYVLPVGIRTVSLSHNAVLVNGEPMYMHTFVFHSIIPFFAA